MTLQDDTSLALSLPRRSPRAAEGFVRRLLSRLECGSLVLRLPSGEVIEHAGTRPGPSGRIDISSWRAVFRIMAGGPMGFAESYMEQEWTSSDLPTLLSLLAVNRPLLASARGTPVSRVLRRLWHMAHCNTRQGSRRNISHHYDLGNDFYRLWLDRGMQYSSALYGPGDDLEMAQQRKLDRIVKLLSLEGGEHVLEIGCGWGAMAERLAERHGCRVTGLTLSAEQLAFARDRLDGLGHGALAEFRLQDYRDCPGAYDRIVSIEMIEAVGEKYWKRYFDTLRERLTPNGRAVIQAITITPDRFDDYRRNADFIQRYIFPGGMLPTNDTIRERAAEAGLELMDVTLFGDSYAKTLDEWRHRFHVAWPAIAAQGFNERFRRMWDYYLAYCEAGFRTGSLDVGLWTLRKSAA